MSNLWSSNKPESFWLPQPAVTEQEWQLAIQKAIPSLELPRQPRDIDAVLAFVLGEAQFGPDHWQLSRAKRLYYVLKPLLPRVLTLALRRMYTPSVQQGFQLGWPIETRYADFQWEVMRQLLLAMGRRSLCFRPFWPRGKRFAFVLTHDVETAEGQAYVRAVADLEESFGFRSSFNFVPERYPLDHGLLSELRERGFEIGVHGLKHDGKLFGSRAGFLRRADRINEHLEALDAAGFRAPLMQRQPEWMQMLDIEYDLSFFDTDPFQPIPGGVMSIWPFILGRFIELPCTLIQDCDLTIILGETTPRLWLQKIDFIEKYHGMALILTHPDYLMRTVTWNVYRGFLQHVKQSKDYWHALPRDVARWWRARGCTMDGTVLPYGAVGQVQLNKDGALIFEED